jgi:hypothetical protein
MKHMPAERSSNARFDLVTDVESRMFEVLARRTPAPIAGRAVWHFV